MKSARQAGQGVAEDPLAQHGALVTPGPKKSEARPMAMRTRPASAAASSTAVIAARACPLAPVAASGRSSVICLPPVGP